MKVTYLVFENGIGSALRVATKEEWNRIMQMNRTLPREQRRFFIRDCIEDCEVIDSLYIEVDKDPPGMHYHPRWNCYCHKQPMQTAYNIPK